MFQGQPGSLDRLMVAHMGPFFAPIAATTVTSICRPKKVATKKRRETHKEQHGPTHAK